MSYWRGGCNSATRVRSALDAFPDAEIASDVLARYFLPSGRPEAIPFRSVPMFTAGASHRLQSLAVLGGFVEVFLARRGHHGRIGINFLQKV
jgi:hypothetical protein